MKLPPETLKIFEDFASRPEIYERLLKLHEERENEKRIIKHDIHKYNNSSDCDNNTVRL